MEAYRKRWENLAFEMEHRTQAEQVTVETLRDQGDANFLIHQGRLLELQDLTARMSQLAANFPEEEQPPLAATSFTTPISEATMEEIIARVKQSMSDSRSNLDPSHESFDDVARSTE